MSLVVATNLTKSYPTCDVFKELNFTLEDGDRVGLIGPNGGGKSTLMRIVAGLEDLTYGQLQRRNGIKIGYLPQDPPPFADMTLWDAMMDVFKDLQTMEEDLHKLAEQMETPELAKSLMDRYGHMQTEFESRGGYVYTSRIEAVLSGLGFTAEQYKQRAATLSGGQQTRAMIARLLLKEPDLLLLDEPTNHLDLESLEWLEKWVTTFKGTMLVISHDRYFLDKATTRTWDLGFGRLEQFVGHYSHYLVQSTERAKERQRVYEQQQGYIAETQDFIRRNIAAMRTGVAKGRRTRLEKFMKEEAVDRPQVAQKITIHLSSENRSGDVVFSAKDLKIGYKPEKVLTHVEELTAFRGQRIAIIGGNGVGKTTLLRTLLGELPPLSGEVRQGGSVQVGYLSQTHHNLDWNKTALQSLMEIDDRLNERMARNMLGMMLIGDDAVFKKVGELSGGQRSRVVLARLSAMGANVLALDEPTNHLDIASQEILQDVLKNYDGTILLVSHDRWLIQALATHIWLVEEAGVKCILGSWDEFRRWRARGGKIEAPVDHKKVAAERAVKAKADAAAKQQAERDASRKQDRSAANRLQNLKRRLGQLESEIHKSDKSLAEKTFQISQAGEAGEVAKVTELGTEYAKIEKKLRHLWDEWTKVSEEIESLGGK